MSYIHTYHIRGSVVKRISLQAVYVPAIVVEGQLRGLDRATNEGNHLANQSEISPQQDPIENRPRTFLGCMVISAFSVALGNCQKEEKGK